MNGTRSAFCGALAALSVMTALTALGCSGDAASEEAPLPPVQPICDGSDDVRFTFSSWAGFANYGSQFTAAYGSVYLAIDGQCNYWVGEESLAGLRSGTLELQASGTLSEELHFGRYFTEEEYRPAIGRCGEGGASVLFDGTGTLRVANCLEQPDPRVVAEAHLHAGELALSLAASSTRAWTRTRLIAALQPDPAEYPEVIRGQAVLRWEAQLDLAERAVETSDVFRGLPPDAGLLIEDAPTLAVLEQLRSAALRSAGTGDDYDLLVRDSEGRYFRLLLRDEPPDAVVNALLGAAARLYD